MIPSWRQWYVGARAPTRAVASAVALPPRLAPEGSANDWARFLARPAEYWDHRQATPGGERALSIVAHICGPAVLHSQPDHWCNLKRGGVSTLCVMAELSHEHRG